MKLYDLFEDRAFFYVLIKDGRAKVVSEEDFQTVSTLESDGWQIVSDSASSEENGFRLAAQFYHSYPEAPVGDKPLPVARLIDTPAFRKWFGRSKVVDRYGRPLRVFHGTLFDVTSFRHKDESQLAIGGAGWGFNRIGFWFDSDPETPNEFASATGNVMPVYLSIQNPLVLRGNPISQTDLDQIKALRDRWLALDPNSPTARTVQRQYQTTYTNLLAATREPFDQLVSEIIPPLDHDAEAGEKLAYTDVVKQVQQDLIDQGYDGIHLVGTMADSGSRDHRPTDWWIAFRPEQIKSAVGNNGRYSSDNSSITESGR